MLKGRYRPEAHQARCKFTTLLGLNKYKVIKYWLEIKLQYKNERAGIEEKWENEQENDDDAYLPFCDTSKTNAKRI